ncbi:uncharacterized protein LOC142813992 [Rhipicephalus microplus]|uniref:uncharacterized protein LOC142813992 n=1 Tax=Rhipicephalus microplus TaxID=6941 RepID=UPI003F6B8C59
MASGNSSLSTTRDDTSDDSAAASHNESSHKENSGADDKQVEAPISVDVENVEPLSEGVSRSLEAGITAASPDNPPKPAKIEADDARMLSTNVVERVSEQALPSSSKGENKINACSADSETDEQWRFLGQSLRSLMLYGLIVVFIAAAFAYAIVFRAGRVLPRKAKRLARLANDTNSTST